MRLSFRQRPAGTMQTTVEKKFIDRSESFMQLTTYASLLPWGMLLLATLFPTSIVAREIRVVVWDEQQPSQREAYPSFLGQYIADYLKRQPGLLVESVSLNHPEKGLSKQVLDACDVLVWWGHVRNGDVSFDESRPVVERIKAGKLSMLALHSAHWATPFVLAMHERAQQDALDMLSPELHASARVEFIGDFQRKAPRRSTLISPSFKIERSGASLLLKMTRPNCCFPAYRNDGKPSQMYTVLADHPIAQGIPKQFALAHTEMYDEPFHVPTPDQVVFEERWEAGERFRSGMVWQLGEGRVVYFRPGHETHAIYTEEIPMRIVENTVRWLGQQQESASATQP